jgi:hypothetical protein
LERGVPSLVELETETTRLMETKTRLEGETVQRGLRAQPVGGEAWRIGEAVEKGSRRVDELVEKLKETKKAWTGVVEMYGVRAESQRNSKEFFDHALKLVKQITKYL